MQPMGRSKKRFPSKINKPKHKEGNWWEDDNDDGQKKTERQRAKKDIASQLRKS